MEQEIIKSLDGLNALVVFFGLIHSLAMILIIIILHNISKK